MLDKALAWLGKAWAWLDFLMALHFHLEPELEEKRGRKIRWGTHWALLSLLDKVWALSDKASAWLGKA